MSKKAYRAPDAPRKITWRSVVAFAILVIWALIINMIFRKEKVV